MYGTTFVDEQLMNVCNDIDCQISSLQYPTIFSGWSVIDSHIFGICFTLSFIVTISVFFLVVMNNIIDILLSLIQKIDRILLNSRRKKELLYQVQEETSDAVCILKDCDHAKAKYAYVNTKIKPICVAFFCEKHAYQHHGNIPVTEKSLPEFL